MNFSIAPLTEKHKSRAAPFWGVHCLPVVGGSRAGERVLAIANFPAESFSQRELSKKNCLVASKNANTRRVPANPRKLLMRRDFKKT